jgi:hypothetical protein
MARRCKKGLRRDGKCRKTKCPTYITKAGYCAKGSRRYGGGKRKTKRRYGVRAYRSASAYQRRYPPSADAIAKYSGRSGFF